MIPWYEEYYAERNRTKRTTNIHRSRDLGSTRIVQQNDASESSANRVEVHLSYDRKKKSRSDALRN